MTNEEMYLLLSAAAMPAQSNGAALQVQAANIKPAQFRNVGERQLLEIADKCPKGNYATGRELSYSSLKQFAKHPLYYLHYCQQEASKATDAQTIGLLFESLLFDQFPSNIVAAKDRPENEKSFAAKANKEWKDEQEAQGKIVASREAIATAYSMANQVRKSSDFLKSREELSHKWQPKYSKTLCDLNVTCIGDVEFPDCVLEIKTCASLASFRNTFFKEGYWLQAAIQSALIGKPVYFLAVQSEAPHLHEVIHITEPQMQEYKRRLGALLRQFRSCLRNGFRHEESMLVIEPTYEFKHAEI